jgi:hypothetical protein
MTLLYSVLSLHTYSKKSINPWYISWSSNSSHLCIPVLKKKLIHQACCMAKVVALLPSKHETSIPSKDKQTKLINHVNYCWGGEFHWLKAVYVVWHDLFWIHVVEIFFLLRAIFKI